LGKNKEIMQNLACTSLSLFQCNLKKPLKGSALVAVVRIKSTSRDNGIQTDEEIQNPAYERKITAHALNPFAT
jgi:hypothetical protein